MKSLKVILIMVLFLAVPVHVHAEEGGMPYSVSLIPPEQQVGQSSYFNLEVTPGETVVLEVEIGNPTDEPVIVNAEVNDALTSGQGFITYNGSGKRSETMAHPFSELVANEAGSVEVSPNSTEIATFEVQVPDESFDGVILGGFHFINESTESQEAEMQIDNLFAYEVGVQMREAGNDTAVEPEFGWHGANATVHDYREVVMAGISNDAPLVAGDVQLTAEISQNDEVIFEDMREDMVFAPNSLMEWPIRISDADLQAGDYDMAITVERDGEEWTFEDTFTITDDEREELDEAAVADEEEPADGTNWLVIGLIGAVLLLAIVILLMFNRMRKQGRE